jgi:hypothetical protein
MKAVRTGILASLLIGFGAVAFSPAVLFADLTNLVTAQLANTVLMVQTVAAQAGVIVPNTASGADSASICLSGGGACAERGEQRLQ